MRVKTMSVKNDHAIKLQSLPSFSKTGSITGMKKKYYGPNALLIRCGSWIYNATSRPDLYDLAH